MPQAQALHCKQEVVTYIGENCLQNVGRARPHPTIGCPSVHAPVRLCSQREEVGTHGTPWYVFLVLHAVPGTFAVELALLRGALALVEVLVAHL